LPLYLITVSGELPLRSSRTRPRFYRRLLENIEDAVARAGGRIIRSELLEAKVLIETDLDVEDVLARVFGVYRVGKVVEYRFKGLQDLATWVAERAVESVKGRKFAVRVKRSGVHEFTSLDVAREVGALLKPHSAGVDLENPEVTIELEVRGDKALLYLDSKRGPGGLPVGVEGRGLVLFSGGFDSPVAAWFTAKRGVMVDFLHFILGSVEPSYMAFKVAKSLAERWLYGYRPRYIVVDFRDVVFEVTQKVDWSYRQVVLRGLMYVAALKIAEEEGYDAIVTGESIGQASSQTLKNISSIEAVVKPTRPILRPLLGLDKEEIVEYNRRLGLYELSSKVAEACAIAPTRVVTAARPEEVERELSKVDFSVVEKAVKSRTTLDLLSSRPEDAIPESDLEIDFLPDDALVIDAREGSKRAEEPLAGAIPIDKVDFERLPRDRPIVVVCDVGNLSSVIAKALRDSGYRAYSLKGGVKTYCKIKRV
jgi:thiamine biosynthesis protein ThiI